MRPTPLFYSRLLTARLLLVGLFATFAWLLALPATASAQGLAAAANGGDDDVNSLRGIVVAGGSVGAVIILLSVVALALVIDHLRTLRVRNLIPPELVAQVQQHVQAGHLAAALEACRARPCALSAVLEAGFSEIDAGWPAMEKAMEDAVAEQAARLYRRIEYLSVIGNIAPMLGLLGTVVGMVFAFRVVAMTQGAARAADLAEGIYKALVTTVEGLVVAIPALGAFAWFRNRVDALVVEVASTAQVLFVPIKHGRLAAKRASPVPPPPPKSS